MRTAIAIFLTVCLTAAPARAAGPPRALRAGAAAVEVTPTEFPVNMPGLFSENIAEKAHDKLFVRALALDDGRTALALVVVDNLGVPREVLDEAKLLASRRCPLLPENVLVSSTHTHSAPPANSSARPAEVAYRKRLLAGIVGAIVEAHARLRPASFGAASEPLPDEVFNRRWHLKPGKMTPNPFGEIDRVRMNPPNSPDVLLKPAGPTDPDVSVLSLREARTGRPLALYANYSLHYVGATPKGETSADYFGEFARLMPSRLRAGEGFVAMLGNGTSGDVNNIPFGKSRPPREPMEQVRIVAGKTADAAWRACESIAAHRTDVRLGMIQREVVLKTRKPTAEQVAKAKAVLAVEGEAERAKLPPLAAHYARRTLALDKGDASVKVLLQAVRVGDVAVCAIPFEVFAEIGLGLKKRSPFGRTVVVGLANGYGGYLPSPAQHGLGGYETWLGTNRVQTDASEVMSDELLDMLARLKR